MDFVFDLFKTTSPIDLFFLVLLIFSVIQCANNGFVLSLLTASKWLLSYIITLYLFPKVKPYVFDLSKNEHILDIILGVGIFMPFIVAAALKSAQGSSTVAIVTTSALVAPMLAQLGLGSEMGRVLTVMAIGAGAMTVSHANDSFFWVVSQFSRMSVNLAYRAQTVATLIQGVTAMTLIYMLSLVML